MFPKKSADWIDWLYLNDGYTPLISRIVGFCSLPIGLYVWFWSHAGVPGTDYPQPFNVPTWRFGAFLLPVPLPPEAVNILVFALFAAAAVLLMWGKWHRSLYIYMASVLAYYTARDFFVCCLHWVLLDFLFLVALAFRARTDDGRSPTRRLIQLTLATCYLFGVLQKIFYPDFWQGISMEAFFYDGFAVNSFCKPLLAGHALPMPFWSSVSIFLLVCETFIGIGLFFKRTRMAACALGVILHGGIFVTMELVLAVFSIEMWTGYLAFFDRRKKAVAPQAESTTTGAEGSGGEQKAAETKAEGGATFKPSQIKTCLSAAFIALLILMPARIYYLPGPPPELLTLFERTPWGFGMFLLRQKVEQLDIVYDDLQGKTHEIKPTGRMATASNDNELLSIADWVLKNHPDATTIRINDLIVVNERRRVLRTLLWEKACDPVTSPKISVTSAGEYCRGAANRNPAGDHHP